MRYGVECLIYNVFGDTSNQLLQHFPSLNNFKPEIEYGWQNKKISKNDCRDTRYWKISGSNITR